MADTDLVTKAKRLEQELKALGLVDDRTFHFVQYKQCFVGSEVIPIIIDLKLIALTDDDALDEENAIQFGNQLIDNNMISHVVDKQHRFQNGNLFYRFVSGYDANLTDSLSPSDIDNSNDLSLQLIVKAHKLEQALKAKNLIKDRKHKLKSYKQCFVGKEAVPMIIELQLISISQSATENELNAIKFGNELIQSNIIQHVTADHFFQNAPLFYSFVDGYDTKLALLQIESDDPEDVKVDEQETEMDRNAMKELIAKAQKLEQVLQSRKLIKDRTFKMQLRSYKQCFVGSDVIPIIIELELVKVSEEQSHNEIHAILFANRLIQHNIIQHVTKEHQTLENEYFYKFLPGYDVMVDRSGPQQDLKLVRSAQVLERKLEEKGLLKDRMYHLKKYKRCFVGKEAVEVIIELKLIPVASDEAENELQAIRFGNALIQHGIIHHVKKEHVFENDHIFYEFFAGYDEVLKNAKMSQNTDESAMMADSESNAMSMAESKPMKTNPYAANAAVFVDSK